MIDDLKHYRAPRPLYGLWYLTVILFIVAAAVVIRFVVLKVSSQSHGNQLGNELSQLLKIREHSSHGWENEYTRPIIKAEIINKVRELMDVQQKP